MDQIQWKIKILVLWIFQVLNFVTILVIPYSYSIVSTEIGAGTGGLITFYIFLTSLMMWLTLVLKPSVIRWPTMLIAAFFAFVKVQWIIQGIVGEYAFEFLFNEIWGFIAALALIWYGWKIPKAQPAE